MDKCFFTEIRTKNRSQKDSEGKVFNTDQKLLQIWSKLTQKNEKTKRIKIKRETCQFVTIFSKNNSLPKLSSITGQKFGPMVTQKYKKSNELKKMYKIYLS